MKKNDVAFALVAVYALVWAWALWADVLARWGLWLLLGVNLLTLLAYGLDKRAAQRGGRRIRERTLHLCSLAGGWPAAWGSQRLLRHKSSKASFQRTYWLTVAMHWLAATGWVYWRASGA